MEDKLVEIKVIMTNLPEENMRLLKAYNDTLNNNGYGFQFSVMKKIIGFSGRLFVQWQWLEAEYPVQLREKSTKIDIVGHFARNNMEYYLLAECKRVYGGTWCFAHSRYANQENGTFYYFEKIQYTPDGYVGSIYANKEYFSGPEIYNVGFEIRLQNGNTPAKPNDSIEKALSQAILGLNGFIEPMAHSTGHISRIVIPVIFTTAQLWVSRQDLSEADIDTGNIEIDNSKFENKKWIAYKYHVSPEYRHSRTQPSSYARTVFIVNSGGIDEFLHWVTNL